MAACSRTVTSSRFERRLPPGKLEPVFKMAFGTFGKAACAPARHPSNHRSLGSALPAAACLGLGCFERSSSADSHRGARRPVRAEPAPTATAPPSAQTVGLLRAL